MINGWACGEVDEDNSFVRVAHADWQPFYVRCPEAAISSCEVTKPPQPVLRHPAVGHRFVHQASVLPSSSEFHPIV